MLELLGVIFIVGIVFKLLVGGHSSSPIDRSRYTRKTKFKKPPSSVNIKTTWDTKEECLKQVETALLDLESKHTVSRQVNARIQRSSDSRSITSQKKSLLKLFPILHLSMSYTSYTSSVPFNYIEEDVIVKDSTGFASIRDNSYTICSFHDAWDCNIALSRISSNIIYLLRESPEDLLDLVKHSWSISEELVLRVTKESQQFEPTRLQYNVYCVNKLK